MTVFSDKPKAPAAQPAGKKGQSKNKQQTDCPYKREGKLILEFTCQEIELLQAKKKFFFH